MDFQHDQSWNNLMEVLDSKLPIKESWNRIINFHESIISKPYWSSLRQLDFETEQDEICNWLEQLVIKSPVPQNILAFWIGITKMKYKSKILPTIYVVGSKSYDNDNIEWACNPVYEPDNRYALPEILAEIDKILKSDKGNYEFFDWLFPMAYCSLTFDDIIRSKLKKELFLNGRKRLFITVGHDEGDFVNVSTIE